MANWREKIPFHGVMDKMCEKYDLSRYEEDCPEEVKEQLALVLHQSNWLSRFSSDIRKSKSIAEVNRIIDQVFNAADRHLVWLGMPGIPS